MDWAKLAAELEGNLVLPGAPTYNLLRQPFNQRVDPRSPWSPDAFRKPT